MPLTREDILELVSGEEPEYDVAAESVGLLDLPVLATMMLEADETVAARATSLAATLALSPLTAIPVVPLLAAAAMHSSPSVRTNAALGATRVGDAALAIIKIALGDPDPAVRHMAFRGLSVPLDPSLVPVIDNMSTTDTNPAVRDQALALAQRNPDPALGNELLAEAIEYAHARLTQFRALALADVAGFTAAVGRPAFVDDGAVAAFLAQARAALDAVVALLVAHDFAGAARQIGLALGAISGAAGKVGGTSFIDLLKNRINWASAVPRGIASQLGLPTAAPVPQMDGTTLVFEYAVPRCALMPPPLTFGFERAKLIVRLPLAAQDPPLSLSLDMQGLEVGVGQGIASLLGGDNGSAKANVVIGVDTTHGITLGGGISRIVLPAHPGFGPLDLREVALEIPPNPAGTFDVSSSITAHLGGAITAIVDGAGLHVRIDPAGAGRDGNPLSVALKPPTGIGLTLDAGIVRGGGFLETRNGAFGGALELRLGPVDVKAVGFLRLDPSFSLVVVMSVGFIPPIDLTFGFTLNAVGGVIGIEHRLDTDALHAVLPTGGLDHIMFPADPVAAAPAILDTLALVFPEDKGSIVIGPMIEIGWGRPVSFLTAQVGVLLSLPDPLIVIIGRARVALPAPQLPIVDLRVVVYGEITPDHLLVRASLNGSRIATFSVFGDAGFLLRWGGTPDLAITAGGFHPRYAPPPELSGLQRLGMDISPPVLFSLRAEAYFAVTPNSVQLGARLEIKADFDIADISGSFYFDALVLLTPQFSFTVEVDFSVAGRVKGYNVAGLHLHLSLSGTSPWRAHGTARAHFLCFSVPIEVGPITWGDSDNPPPEPVDPRQLVRDALHNKPGGWQALPPPDSDRVVHLRPAAPSDTEVTVHPMGQFEVRQHVIPLETQIVRVGAHPVPEGQRRVYFGVPLVNTKPAGAISEVTDDFSAGVYLDLTEDQKLYHPSFEPMPAGARIRAPGESVDYATAIETDLRYETFVCLDPAMQGKTGVGQDFLIASSPRTALGAGAAGRSALRARIRYATEPDPLALAHASESQVLAKDTLAIAAGTQTTIYTKAAERTGDDTLQIARLGVA